MTLAAIHWAAATIWVAMLGVALCGVPIATPETVGDRAYAIDAEIWFMTAACGHVFCNSRPVLGWSVLAMVYVGFPALTWYDDTTTPAALASLGFGGLLVIVGVIEWVVRDG